MALRRYLCESCGSPATKSGTGLGTWHCANGCKKRRFTTERRMDSGKESERSSMNSSYPVRRAIKVKVERGK